MELKEIKVNRDDGFVVSRARRNKKTFDKHNSLL